MTAPGPLGLARVCSPRLHAGLDVAVALALALAPVAPALRPDLPGIVAAELAAMVWIRVAMLTRYRRPAGAPAAADPPRGGGTETQDRLAHGARRAGRHAARHVGRVQRAWRQPPGTP